MQSTAALRLDGRLTSQPHRTWKNMKGPADKDGKISPNQQTCASKPTNSFPQDRWRWITGSFSIWQKGVSLEMFFGPNNTTAAESCKFQEEASMKTKRLYMRHAWHCIYVKPGWAQLVWMSYLSPCFVRKLTSCEFAAEASIWPQLSGDDSLAERELTGAAALLCRQMLPASPRLSGDHHCFLWAPLCLVLWSVPLITACLPAFFPTSCQSSH